MASIRNILNSVVGAIIKPLGLTDTVFNLIERYKIVYHNVKFGRQLKHVVKRPNAKQAKFPLFCCLRNEMHRMPYFIKYYRNMGVDHFFFIDNDSDDGFLEYIKDQEDCSVWHSKHSYRASNFGMWWCNSLLKKYGTGKWCVTVDPDEFMVYPNIENRNLPELTQHLDNINQNAMLGLMIDAYSSKDITQTYLGPNDSPFDVCPYMDRYNYTQQMNDELGNCWIQGGVRMRKFFTEKPHKAPAQNKVPLIKWRKDIRYLSSMHHTNTKDVNCTVSLDDRFLSGAIFHFKYISAIQEKIEEEMHRKEHYESGNEYKGYKDQGYSSLFDPHWSIAYINSKQLVNLKFIHRGEWF